MEMSANAVYDNPFRVLERYLSLHLSHTNQMSENLSQKKMS